jgi:hypothetical protein
LEELVAPDTAGDPTSGQTWVRSSLRTLSARLTEAGHPVSPPTVGRLLKSLDYALHVNAKKIEASATHPDRAQQFDYIAQQRQAFTAAGRPTVSVDTKKKELIGNFKNAGRTWSQEAEPVNVHDFRGQALGRAVPYGIYDLTHNRGTVYVGSSGDTAQFAVEALAQWWQTTGQSTFPQAEHLLILADGGGSNGYRSRLWKQQLQERVCDECAPGRPCWPTSAARPPPVWRCRRNGSTASTPWACVSRMRRWPPSISLRTLFALPGTTPSALARAGRRPLLRRQSGNLLFNKS